jgi:PLP dependent protein
MDDDRDDMAARIGRIRERIARAAERAGRDPGTVRLIGAAKTMPAAVVRAAIAAGLTDIGENYVQEAEAVRAETEMAARWHLIGHLQRNKAARAASLFDVVQTVDRLSLGSALSRHAAALGKVLPILVEVNLGGEASKSGVAPAQLAELVGELRRQPALRVDGLMAIPPPGDEGEARRHFRRLRELRDDNELDDLSMGMSDDFELAVEEGATMVRVGRAIFGERG